ncbi:hypothetical protein TNCT_121591 [Trichonephila clavata]|uniref:Uncharacterized protein n=1 Tax=Trichonephila clavata TaxID=2740835 RepID=A0A8X6LR62_TRICU|nr:hypothetical protein TNCT_121591 [Trichonephila clavata]
MSFKPVLIDGTNCSPSPKKKPECKVSCSLPIKADMTAFEWSFDNPEGNEIAIWEGSELFSRRRYWCGRKLFRTKGAAYGNGKKIISLLRGDF